MNSRKRKKRCFQVEPLEGRIAPASGVSTSSLQGVSAVPAVVAPEAGATSIERRTLKLGDHNGDVVYLQQTLMKLGYSVGPGKDDGIFGPATEKAVEAFQADHPPLERDGIVGPQTWATLERVSQPIGGLVRPLTSKLTPGSEFKIPDPEGAPSKDGRRYHAAKDWFAPSGMAVHSPVAGKIVQVKSSQDHTGQVFGGVVKVQAGDGKVWVFRHVDPAQVREGQQVNAGRVIAHVSAWRDGPTHTHIELWKTLGGGYNFENMIDPMIYLGRFI